MPIAPQDASRRTRETCALAPVVPVLVIEYFIYARRGWPAEQLIATAQVAALAGLLVVFCILLSRWRKRYLPSWLSLTLVASLVLVPIIWP